MRPQHLKIGGFTSYREPAEVDFTDLDLFAITGPTGAGKSSLSDAMTFALFGKSPRVDIERQSISCAEQSVEAGLNVVIVDQVGVVAQTGITRLSMSKTAAIRLDFAKKLNYVNPVLAMATMPSAWQVHEARLEMKCVQD